MRFVLAGVLGLIAAVLVGLLLLEMPASGQNATRPVCPGYVCTPSPTPNRPGGHPSSHPPTSAPASTPAAYGSPCTPAGFPCQLPATGQGPSTRKWIFVGLGLGAVTVGLLMLAYTLVPRRAH